MVGHLSLWRVDVGVVVVVADPVLWFRRDPLWWCLALLLVVEVVEEVARGVEGRWT